MRAATIVTVLVAMCSLARADHEATCESNSDCSSDDMCCSFRNRFSLQCYEKGGEGDPCTEVEQGEDRFYFSDCTCQTGFFCDPDNFTCVEEADDVCGGDLFSIIYDLLYEIYSFLEPILGFKKK